MKLAKKLCLLFLIVTAVLPAAAQFPFSKSIDVEEENLTLKTTVLLKDHSGFIWIGTSEGLFKYNTTIPEKISDSLHSKIYVTALFEDASGIIWIGCKNGAILMLKHHQFTAYTPKEGLPNVPITSVYQDAAKRIWFATAGMGLFYKDNSGLHNITTRDGLSDDNVNCLFSSDGRQIIAGTDRGLSFIDYTEGKKDIWYFTSKNGLPDNIVRCIVRVPESSQLCIGTQSKGILFFDATLKKITYTPDKLKWTFGQVNKIIALPGEMFIATDNSVISYSIDGNEFNNRVLKDTVFPRQVTDMQTDNEENIWVAAENKILSFTAVYLKYYYGSKKTPFTKVHTLIADEENRLWFTPDFRLFVNQLQHLSQDEREKSYDITPPKDHVDITSLYKDQLGFVWIGTMGEGLFRMNTQTGEWRRIAENPIAFYGNILSIAGKGNQVWISTLNGVARFDLKMANYDLNEKINYTNFSKKDGLGSDYVYHILIDSKNRVWFATDGAGVAVYEKEIFMNFYQNKLFPSKVAYSLAEDKKGHIWVSTYNDGLFEYNEKQFRQYGIKNGLSDLAITSINTDEFDNIIAINKKGIDVFNPQKNTVQHFGSESGFTELQPNLNSITKDRLANLWIGTDNGIVCLKTQHSFSSHVPLAVIEEVELFNNRVNTDVDSVFSYDQNNFSFKLAAAYYKAPEKLKFQYWLDGYSKKWEITSDRLINFPQLHPGKYIMKIRASANENFDASPVTTYQFTINQSFWTTWWFRTMLVLLIAGLVYVFFKQRVKQIKKTEHAEREKFQLQYDALKNQVNPHFLFNSFNALMNIVEDNPKDAAVLIKHLSQFYRKMTAYSQKELISLTEELELLHSYLYIQQKRYGYALQVSVNIEAAIKKATFIPPLVLQLLAENAVKHNTVSKDKPLFISVNILGDYIVMRNSINYKLEKEESEGVGLQNIRNRYKLLTEREIIQEVNNNEFVIMLPLIHSN
jgi:ligand-binding sensor domain-containing protein